ncbi:MAG: group II intron reverse transcriptase domain-containing protein [Kiritimatiellae bacterium]|nr:group II intron reverse transcriptase domain-containing protein [Kiritimatiellia bacterium]
MKSYGQLWEKITSEENLRAGWRNFRRFHSSKPATKKFERRLEANLGAIRKQLIERRWRPSNYHQFRVYEPKPRTISSVRIQDRVVHHAFCNVCGPLMDRRFIDQTYACRKGKGSHMACLRARELAAKHRYFLKMDVRHYFESIDHDILVGIVSRMFREREVRGLAEMIIRKEIPHREAGKALPIGNLTSQWFANLYLDGLDHFAVETLRLGGRYIRYMDDFLVFTDSKEEAWAVHGEIRDWLSEHRSLALKEEATVVAPVSEGVPFLGLRIWKSCWHMRHSRLKRTRRSARKYYKAVMRGGCTEEKLQEVMRSMEGAANWFGFKGIYARLDEEFGIMKGNNEKEKENIDTGFGRHLSAVCSRVIRGGSANGNAAAWYRSGSRNRNNGPTNSNWNNGFRLSSTCDSANENDRGGNCKTTQTEDLLHKSHPKCPAPREAGTNMQHGGPERVGAFAHKALAASAAAVMAAATAFAGLEASNAGDLLVASSHGEDVAGMLPHFVDHPSCLGHDYLPDVVSLDMKSSCDVSSPRSISASAALTSSRSSSCSMSSSNLVELSQSTMLSRTEVGRPFCVTMIGRCVRRVLSKYSPSLPRHSVNEITSSERIGRCRVFLAGRGLADVDMMAAPFVDANSVSHSDMQRQGAPWGISTKTIGNQMKGTTT